MFTASLLSLLISTSMSTKSVDLSSQAITAKAVPIQIAAYDPIDDPGKDLTRDPNEENHDKKLPANSPDDYLNGEQTDQKGDDE